MNENDPGSPGSGETMALPHGDCRLLRSDVAKRLLVSRRVQKLGRVR